MGKTKIEWADRVWNPMTGCLGQYNNGVLCPYCYAHDLAIRFNNGDFAPKWHPERLNEPLRVRKPSKFFVGSVTDIFGNWVTDSQIDQMLDIMANCPQHTFYLLTKQPQNIIGKIYNSAEKQPFIFRRSLPRNVWIGTTVTDFRSAEHAQQYMGEVVRAGWHTFVSIEPFLNVVPSCSLWWPEWIIIGGLSRQGQSPKQPKKEWVESVLEAAERWKRPVFMKKNLIWEPHREEWFNVEQPHHSPP